MAKSNSGLEGNIRIKDKKGKNPKQVWVDYSDRMIGMLPILLDETFVAINKSLTRKFPFYVNANHVAILSFCTTSTRRSDIGRLPYSEVIANRMLKQLTEHGYLIKHAGYCRTTEKGEELIHHAYHRLDMMHKRWNKDYEILKDRKTNYNGDTD